MENWTIHHKELTASTNLDARAGAHGDIYTADFQSAGRGRLDHKWMSPKKTNLLMSVVLGVTELPIETVAQIPLAVGLAVLRGIEEYCLGSIVWSGLGSIVRSGLGSIVWSGRPRPDEQQVDPPHLALKWPNDVLLDGRKVAGILCERHGDNVIAGIGINVLKQEFPDEIKSRATYLGGEATIEGVRDAVIAQVFEKFETLRREGFAAIHAELEQVDFLKGREISVRQTDEDREPVRGLCSGINDDGSLDVAGVKIYAGEAHVMEC